MTPAEVKARTHQLIIPKIAQRILAANTPALADVLAREIVETISNVAAGMEAASHTAEEHKGRVVKTIEFPDGGIARVFEQR